MINITILVDDEKSWFIPYAKKLKTNLEKKNMHVSLIHDQNQAKAGEISFLLSCSKIVGNEFLEKFDHNIVVHASDLPQGKGFTPMKWQILGAGETAQKLRVCTYCSYRVYKYSSKHQFLTTASNCL